MLEVDEPCFTALSYYTSHCFSGTMQVGEPFFLSLSQDIFHCYNGIMCIGEPFFMSLFKYIFHCYIGTMYWCISQTDLSVYTTRWWISQTDLSVPAMCWWISQTDLPRQMVEVEDETCCVTRSLCTTTGPTSLSTDSRMPGAWQGGHHSHSVNNNNNNDFISKALFHVKHAQLRCTMPMNNTHTHTHTRARARASKTSYERTIAYKSLKHNTIC